MLFVKKSTQDAKKDLPMIISDTGDKSKKYFFKG